MGSASRLPTSVALGLGLVAFLAVGSIVGRWLGCTEAIHAGFDEPLLGWITEHRSQGATEVFQFITRLGSAPVMIVVTLLVAAAALRRGERSAATTINVVLLGAEALFHLIKLAVGRERPDQQMAIGHASGSAFPSGHATVATAVALGIALLLTDNRDRGHRQLAAGSAISLGAAVGLSRLYLGLHWPTDVIGGCVLGAGWATFAVRSPLSDPLSTASEARRRCSPSHRTRAPGRRSGGDQPENASGPTPRSGA